MKYRMLSNLFIFIFLFAQNRAAVQAQTAEQNVKQNKRITYQNPIIPAYLADPFIRFENGFYYLFATGGAADKRYIPIYRSRDLSSWEFVRGAVINGQKEDWNYKHFWAPEVIKIGDKFYLYYTASPDVSPANSGNRVGVAVADNIEGPYENIGVVIPNGSIDGHPVFDKDSTMYMYYSIEWQNSKGFKAGQIFIDKMLSPTKVADNPQPLITLHNWQEGAFLLQRDNTYYLTYSCGAWSDSTYHLRYAKSDRITGPYIEQADTIIKSNAMVKGPGHHSIFKHQNNGDWIVYHGWDTAYKARYPRIDPIQYTNGKITCAGPTYTPQSVKMRYKRNARKRSFYY